MIEEEKKSTKEIKTGVYLVADERKNHKPKYNEKTCMYFPRMYSTQGHHVNAYKIWSDYDGAPVEDSRGKVLTVKEPTARRE